MRTQAAHLLRISLLFAFFSLPGLPASAQNVPVPSRITQAVDEASLTVLKGNTYYMARAEFDQGPAPLDLPMNRILLVLRRSPDQESALQQLLNQQQDQSSPNFHKWLTPLQFGQQFGPSDQDVQAVTSWLQSHGFQVARVSNGRTVIEFSGTAAQVQEALHTSIHKYSINGEEHWANSANPSVPTALAPVIVGLASLHNFSPKPMNHYAGAFSRSKATGLVTAINPQFTEPGGCDQDGNCYAVGPYDFATIYNVTPLWTAGTDGTGQTIAIVAQTDIHPQDFTDFHNVFGQSVPTLNIIHDGPAPGIIADEPEADIDTQWSSAVAKAATIDFVVSASTNSSAGVNLSAEYIVDNNLAGVMSESYGFCELGLGTGGNQFFNSLWEQAASQGISVFVSTGDSGSAGCDSHNNRSPAPSQFGLQVNGFASTPFNVAVGGTDFNDPLTPSVFWNSTNDIHQSSAKSYIPESVWNDTCTNPEFVDFGFSNSAATNCNNPQLSPFVNTVGGSGGASSCINGDGGDISSCSIGYAKPSWQSGTGVPADHVRDIPDVSLFASNGFNGSFYIICQSDVGGGDNSCDLTQPNLFFQGFGGTSVATPAMAGIMALVDQKTGSRQGNPNYVLYKLAAKSGASCNSSGTLTSTCIFYDVTTGTNSMPCVKSVPGCTFNPSTAQYGVLNGYTAAPGYDLATGLGSVNAANLVAQWSSVTTTFKPSATTLTLTPATNIAHGSSVTVNINVSATPPASGTPTGDVSLIATSLVAQGTDAFTLAGGAVNSTTTLLPGGDYNVTAHYAGDGTFAPSDSAPVAVTVQSEPSTTVTSLFTVNSLGSVAFFNSGPYGSPVRVRADVAGASRHGVPTGNITFADTLPPLFAGNPYGLNSEGYTVTPSAVSTFAPGSHSITAHYGGDLSFQANTSVPAPFTITQASTNMTLEGTGGDSNVGQSIRFFGLLGGTSCGNPPTGTVTFFNGTTQIGSPLTIQAFTNDCQISGNVALDVSTLPVGVNSITAKYGGDANYTGSTSAVGKADIQIPTTIAVSTSAPTIQQGTSVTFTATLTPSQSFSTAPTGTVQFSSNNTNIGAPVTLSGGVAAFTTNSLPVGSLDVLANYSGDNNYAITQAQIVETVNPGPTATLTFNPVIVDISAPGGTGSTVITVTGANGYNGTIPFSASSCSALPAESSCSFSASSLTGNGMVTLTVSTTARGAISPATRPFRWDSPTTANTAMRWALISFVLFLLLIATRSRRRTNILAAFLLAGCLLAGAACGGGSSGGGGTPPDPGTPAVNNAAVFVNLTPSSGTISGPHQFMLTVQ